MQIESTGDQESITTCVRIKPVDSNQQITCQVNANNQIELLRTQECFGFQYVFDQNMKTNQIYDQLGNSIIGQALQGYNVCVFVYGQTCSGKTHTMKGDSNEPGIIPLAMQELFSKVNNGGDTFAEVKISYLEIYNENIRDLLGEDQTKTLDVRQCPERGIYVQNLHEQQIQTQEDALKYFQNGESNRKFGKTGQNDNSSRSHTIFRVNIKVRQSGESVDKVATINLIDLAGSESVSKANTQGMARVEGLNINKSLLALSTVIEKLSNKSPFISYRESKLTRLLQTSLEGNSKTMVICTINPLLSSYSETRDTLKFGLNAGAIKNKVTVNISEKKQVGSGILMNSAEIIDLKEENQQLKNKIDSFDQLIVDMQNEVNNKQKEVDTLNVKIQNLEQIQEGEQQALEQKISDFNKQLDEKDSQIQLLQQNKKNLEFNLNYNKNDQNEKLQYQLQNKDKEISQLRSEVDDKENQNNSNNSSNNNLIQENINSNKNSNNFFKNVSNKNNSNNILNNNQNLEQEKRLFQSNCSIQSTGQINTQTYKLNLQENDSNHENFENNIISEIESHTSNQNTSQHTYSDQFIKKAKKDLYPKDNVEQMTLVAILEGKLLQCNTDLQMLHKDLSECREENINYESQIRKLNEKILKFQNSYPDFFSNSNESVFSDESLSKRTKTHKRIKNSPTKEEIKQTANYQLKQYKQLRSDMESMKNKLKKQVGLSLNLSDRYYALENKIIERNQLDLFK